MVSKRRIINAVVTALAGCESRPIRKRLDRYHRVPLIPEFALFISPTGSAETTAILEDKPETGSIEIEVTSTKFNSLAAQGLESLRSIDGLNCLN
jgi:hypothetical protein